MHTNIGDTLAVAGHHVGEHERTAEILEVRGADGGPPYLVRWLHDDHVTLVHPGPDAVIRHPAGKR
jgi:uncharacterized protein DUF1918